MAVVYSVGEFSGPIEILLQMIESEKMPISEVSLLRVTEQFLVYVKSMPQFDADLVSRFLAIAATLLSIKAYSLLPVPDMEEEVEADIHELELRLKMYSALREASKLLEQFYKSSKPLFSRPANWRTHATYIPDLSLSLDVLNSVLRDMCDRNVELSESKIEDLPEVRIRSTKTIEEVMFSITERITKSQGYTLKSRQGSVSPAERAEALISFLAILELVRNGIIEAVQENYEGDIVVPARA